MPIKRTTCARLYTTIQTYIHIHMDIDIYVCTMCISFVQMFEYMLQRNRKRKCDFGFVLRMAHCDPKSPKYNKLYISFNSISFTKRNRIRTAKATTAKRRHCGCWQNGGQLKWKKLGGTKGGAKGTSNREKERERGRTIKAKRMQRKYNKYI